jgi:hypothetical protein
MVPRNAALAAWRHRQHLGGVGLAAYTLASDWPVVSRRDMVGAMTRVIFLAAAILALVSTDARALSPESEAAMKSILAEINRHCERATENSHSARCVKEQTDMVQYILQQGTARPKEFQSCMEQFGDSPPYNAARDCLKKKG